MRIVQLTDQYAPSIGGTERHVARLAEALTARGHQLAVVTMGRPGLPAHEVDAAGVEIFRIDAPELAVLRRGYRDDGHSFHPPFPLPGTARALAGVIGKWGADVVHGHNWLTYPLLSVKGRLDVPVAHTLHDYGAVCPKMTLLRPDNSICAGPQLGECLRCATTQYSAPVAAGLTVGLKVGARLHDRIDRILAVSQPVASAQQQAFSRPIEVVPTFIPDGLVELVADQPRPDFLPDGPYLLYVGALAPHKGLGVLLEAYRRLPEPRLPLVLLGVRKPDTPDLTGEPVVVVENVPHRQVMAAWRDAHVGIVPSVWAEPWGQVVAEALTVGCPLAVSDSVGLAPQVEAADAGLLVPAGDPAALAASIERLMEDRDLAERCAANGRTLAAGLTVSAVVNHLERIFVEMVGGA
jgi:glycosyltransferase involved in cell wall biosynthesis